MNQFDLEKLSINHWPALSTSYHDGWILNISEGYTKRANCIHPIYYSTKELNDKLLYCEALYRNNQLPTIFKISPFVQPSNLDQLLQQKGYHIENESILLTLPLDDISAPSQYSVTYLHEPSIEWLQFHAQVNQLSEKHKSLLKSIITNIKQKKIIIALIQHDCIVAAGIGVLERGYIGIYCLATAKPFRNKGYATQIMLHLLNWGKKEGASTSYILVDAQNGSANHLYDKLGYKELYKYWYRVKQI